jgi:hypothetical protein
MSLLIVLISKPNEFARVKDVMFLHKLQCNEVEQGFAYTLV